MITIDLPGFGDSPAAPAVTPMDYIARRVVTTLDSIGAKDPAILVGLSMGGYVLLQIARLFPERVRAAAFLSTRSTADVPEAKQKRVENAELVQKKGVPAFLDAALPGLLGESSKQERPEIVKQAKDIASSQSAGAISAALRGMAERSDTSTVLEGLRGPAIFIAGAEDTVVRPAEMETMSKRAKNAEFHTVEKAGHLVSLERPDAVNDLLSQFLKRRVL